MKISGPQTRTTPYPVQVDHEFGKHFLRENLRQFALVGGGFLVTFLDFMRTLTLGLWGVLGLIATAIGFIQISLSERRRLKNYHCPTCGKHLAGPLIRDLSESAKQAYTYDCEDCETTWDTTLRVPSD